MLEDLLKKGNCFKLICGAGNEDAEQIKKLVALYSRAGCHFFDLSANKNILIAAQEGLDFSIPKEEQKEYHFCISVGTKNDPHITKAKIDSDLCKKCSKCIEICPQNAINEYFKISDKKCIGCLKCKNICNNDAIESYQNFKSLEKVFEELSEFIPSISCIELHALDEDEKEVDEKWAYLNENFNGILSLCTGRAKLSNKAILTRIKRLLKDRKPYTTIIQTDGSAMSGGKDDFQTTLPSIAMAEFIQNANLPVYIMPSGGTNSKTAELAKICNVNLNGIAVGSYARKIVEKYLANNDFFTDKNIFLEAEKIASELIFSCSNF